MFTIYDGREHFYQWDLEQKLIVDDATIDEVHFCNKTTDCSLVLKVEDQEGERIVSVPNILLQTDWPIHVYAYCTNHTKIEEIFKVIRRSKPADYVYTETEIVTLEKILETVEEINENIGAATKEYIEQNKEEVLEGYATEEYVDEAVADCLTEVEWEAIKNKPFHSEVTEAVLYENNALAIDDTVDGVRPYYHYKGILSGGGEVLYKALTTYNDYFVRFEGNEYRCECISYQSSNDNYASYYLGNTYIYANRFGASVANNTGEPFLIEVTKSRPLTSSPIVYNAYIYLKDKPELGHNFSLSIYEIEDLENVKTIDERYIPDTVARTSDLVDYCTIIDVDEWLVSNDYIQQYQLEEALEDALADVEVDVDLSDYALKSELPNLDNYALKSEIPAAPDLNQYALKTEIPDTSSFTTMAAVEGKGYQTAAQVNTLITNALGVIENGAY